jgi:hypothetical protein
MAYSPFQEWDKGMSYSYGQSCVYRGFPYVWFHPLDNSTAGTKPNEEMKTFTAASESSTDTRSDRGWVLSDVGGSGFGVFMPNYGNAAAIMNEIRGGTSSTATILGNPQGIKYSYVPYVDGSAGKISWSYYGWNRGMSVDYDAGGIIYVGVYSPTADNPADMTQPRPNQNNAHLPILSQIELDPPDPDTVSYQATWIMDANEAVQEGGADTAAQLLWLEREFDYTLTVKFYKYDGNGDPELISTETATGSITSPSYSDGFEDTPTVGDTHTFDRPAETEYVVWSYNIDSVTPATDS